MKTSVLAGLIIAAFIVILIIYFTPPTDDFDPDNSAWNGLLELMSKLHAIRLESIFEAKLMLNPSNTSLLIIGPEKKFYKEEASILREFIESGGRVILADDFGSGNQLLELLGVDAQFNGSLLLDPLFMERSMKLPRIRSLVSGVEEIVFNYGTIISNCQKPIAKSSYYSFLDLNLNGIWDADEPKGPFTTACILRIGRGDLILISDSSVWINSMLSIGDNLAFLKSLTDHRQVFIDESHWLPNSLSIAKKLLIKLFSFIASSEVKYALVAGFLVAIAEVGYRRATRAEASNVEKVLMRNPTWDRQLLIRLEREMQVEQ